MPNKLLLVSAAWLVFLFGCASSKKTDAPPAAAASGSKTTPAPAASGSKAAPAPARTDGRKVKSKDGKVDGEIFGTPGAKSKFAKLEIVMSLGSSRRVPVRPAGAEVSTRPVKSSVFLPDTSTNPPFPPVCPPLAEI